MDVPSQKLQMNGGSLQFPSGLTGFREGGEASTNHQHPIRVKRSWARPDMMEGMRRGQSCIQADFKQWGVGGDTTDFIYLRGWFVSERPRSIFLAHDFPQYHCIWSKPQVGPSDKMVHFQLPSLFLEMTQPSYTISREPPRYWRLLCGRMGASLSPTYLRTNRLETLWGNGDSFLLLPECSSSPVNLCMCCVCLAAHATPLYYFKHYRNTLNKGAWSSEKE